jgi:acetolactate synthase-1/2/3 large subunit
VPQVGAVWDEADIVLAIGSDFDGMMTLGWKLPQPPALIALNVDPEDAAKNYTPDLMIEADAAAGARALHDAVAQRPGLDALASRTTALRAEVRAEIERTDPDAAAFLTGLERVLPADATVVCDMCIPGYWIGGFLTVAGPRRLAYPLGWGTLGCGFPQGLGAALAGTGPVVSISGDGGFLYAPGELAAAAQERIPLTAVIVDDGGYGMLRFDQEIHGDPHEGVDLVTPDFVALAGAFGVRAEAIDGLGDDFMAALERHLALDEPSMLVAGTSLRPPPNTSPRWYRR